MSSDFSTARELSEKINTVKRLLRRPRVQGEMPDGMFGILAVADMHMEHTGQDTVRLGQICHMLHRSMPSITRAANVLEEEGYIVRAVPPEDRRAVTISLTPKGHQALEHMREYRYTAIESVLARLGEEQTAQLFSILDSLAIILDEMRREKD